HETDAAAADPLRLRRDLAAVDVGLGGLRSDRAGRDPPLPHAVPAPGHPAAVLVLPAPRTAVDAAVDDGAAVSAPRLLHRRAALRLPQASSRQARARPATGERHGTTPPRR